MHLKSRAHNSTRYQCPGCFRWFFSISALTNHAESSIVRCGIRNSVNFRHFLDQLTAGIVDVDGCHPIDLTNRYVVPRKAIDDFAPANLTQAIDVVNIEVTVKEEIEKKERYWQQHSPDW
jgi:hypothetical protein